MALRPPPKPREFISLCDEVAAAAAGPMFDVQFGPNGVQWCSDALLDGDRGSLVADRPPNPYAPFGDALSARLGDAAHPDGVVQHMDRLGLLSPRLTLAHCVWARPDELELLAARGVTIAVNTSSNLHLRSGIAPVARMVATGCRIALGIDGGALDDDDDALRELRLLHLLHVGKGFEVACQPRAAATGRVSPTAVSRSRTRPRTARPRRRAGRSFAARLGRDRRRPAARGYRPAAARPHARHVRGIFAN